MTEQEAIETIAKAIEYSEKSLAELDTTKKWSEKNGKLGEYYSIRENVVKEIDASKISIKALEEIQPYREIGTVDEIKQKLAELKRWHTTEVNPKIKNVFANTSTSICHNCDHKDEYIEELESEIEEYRTIGTVEELRIAKEKQISKKSIKDKFSRECCPSCGWIVYKDEYGGRNLPHCENCGQAIDWSDTD